MSATTTGHRAARACASASRVCGITPSSAATASTTMSVAAAPRARMAPKAAWPGVSRKVRVLPLPGILTSKAPMCCVMPPASATGRTAQHSTARHGQGMVSIKQPFFNPGTAGQDASVLTQHIHTHMTDQWAEEASLSVCRPLVRCETHAPPAVTLLERRASSRLVLP